MPRGELIILIFLPLILMDKLLSYAMYHDYELLNYLSSETNRIAHSSLMEICRVFWTESNIEIFYKINIIKIFSEIGS